MTRAPSQLILKSWQRQRLVTEGDASGGAAFFAIQFGFIL